MKLKATLLSNLAAVALLNIAPTLAHASDEAPTCRYAKEAIDIPDDPKPGIIALTFDDGPDRDLTPHVLDILKKYNIKATFFLIGSNIPGNEAIVRRELAEGHNIGVHTWTHPHIPQISTHQMHVEIRKTDEILKQFPKNRARVMRFPYGESTCEAVSYVESLHYNVIGWDIDSCDWSYGEGLEKSDCVDKALQKTYAGNYQDWIDHQLEQVHGGVFLMHDAEEYEGKHLEAEIVHLKKLGYKFAELDKGGLWPQMIHDMTGYKPSTPQTPIAPPPPVPAPEY